MHGSDLCVCVCVAVMVAAAAAAATTVAAAAAAVVVVLCVCVGWVGVEITKWAAIKRYAMLPHPGQCPPRIFMERSNLHNGAQVC